MKEVNSDYRNKEEGMEIVTSCARNGKSVDKTVATDVQL